MTAVLSLQGLVRSHRRVDQFIVPRSLVCSIMIASFILEDTTLTRLGKLPPDVAEGSCHGCRVPALICLSSLGAKKVGEVARRLPKDGAWSPPEAAFTRVGL